MLGSQQICRCAAQILNTGLENEMESLQMSMFLGNRCPSIQTSPVEQWNCVNLSDRWDTFLYHPLFFICSFGFRICDGRVGDFWLLVSGPLYCWSRDSCDALQNISLALLATLNCPAISWRGCTRPKAAAIANSCKTLDHNFWLFSGSAACPAACDHRMDSGVDGWRDGQLLQASRQWFYIIDIQAENGLSDVSIEEIRP